jgi:hypothetical protein
MPLRKCSAAAMFVCDYLFSLERSERFLIEFAGSVRSVQGTTRGYSNRKVTPFAEARRRS